MYEPCVVQDAQMSRHAGLVDDDGVDDVVHRTLTAAQQLNDVSACGIGQRLKGIQMHVITYV